MNKPTFASLFGGGRLADIGAMQAGCHLIWDVEVNLAIAEVGAQLPGKVYTRSVTEMDWRTVERPDILWASPPCTNFSVAKTNAVETEQDKTLALAVVDAIDTLLPPVFILENVEGYKRSASLEFIEGALFALGYWVDRQVVNAADFGVPQTRRRLILRAIKGGFVPSLPQPQAWKGWYQAVEDLVPSLPETKLAQWQIDRMPETLVSCLVPGGNASSFSVRELLEPSRTIGDAERVGNMPRAILVENKYANQQYGDGLLYEQEPTTTITTGHKSSHQPRAILLDVQILFVAALSANRISHPSPSRLTKCGDQHPPQKHCSSPVQAIAGKPLHSRNATNLR